METRSKRKDYIHGLQLGIPIAIGYFVVSLSLGLNAATAGFSFFQATLCSALCLASAGEYALFSLVGASAGYLEVAIMAVVVNARYMLMSCAFSQKLDEKVSFGKRLLLGMSITDEMFGASILQEGKVSPVFCYGMMSVAIPGWTLGTALGVVIGNTLPENLVTALSVSLYGMFIASVVPAAKKSRIVCIIVLISAVCSYFFNTLSVFEIISPGFRLIILTVVVSVAAAFFFPLGEDGRPAGRRALDAR